MKPSFSHQAVPIISRASLSLVALVLCVSCSGDKADINKSADQESKTAPNTPKSEPIKEKPSRYLEEIGKDQHQETAPPKDAPIFKWDFSDNRVINYTFEQDSFSMSGFGAESRNSSQEISAKGLLLIKSKGDNTAELVLKDTNASMKMNMGKGDTKTMEQKMPPFVVQGIKENGVGSFGQTSQDLMMKMLFPLPTKQLAVGESVDVPETMPFRAQGSVLEVKGHRRITLARYVNIGNRTCAQLNVDTQITEIEIPEELKGEYKFSLKEKSVFYFDVNNRSFVSGKIANTMYMHIDAPMPQMNMPGKEVPKMPKSSQLSMFNDTFIRVNIPQMTQ